MVKICKSCGKSDNEADFERNRKECSKCRYQRRKSTHTNTCRTCGITFKTQRRDQINCSHECASESRRYTEEEFEELVRDKKDFTLISKYVNYRTKLEVRHSCGYEFKVFPSNFIYNESGCPKCYGNMPKTNEAFTEEIEGLVGREYSLESSYTGNKNKITVKHNECGRSYDVTPDKFLRGGRCPNCFFSRGEKRIKEFLDEMSIDYLREYVIDECRHKLPLPFDFAVFNKERLILLIEYDGDQHFIPKDFWGGKKGLEETKKRDSIKDNYCEENEIKLLRIPYTDFDNVEKILNKELDV